MRHPDCRAVFGRNGGACCCVGGAFTREPPPAMVVKRYNIKLDGGVRPRGAHRLPAVPGARPTQAVGRLEGLAGGAGLFGPLALQACHRPF
jgi:hypothetical protein